MGSRGENRWNEIVREEVTESEMTGNRKVILVRGGDEKQRWDQEAE